MRGLKGRKASAPWVEEDDAAVSWRVSCANYRWEMEGVPWPATARHPAIAVCLAHDGVDADHMLRATVESMARRGPKPAFAAGDAVMVYGTGAVDGVTGWHGPRRVMALAGYSQCNNTGRFMWFYSVEDVGAGFVGEDAMCPAAEQADGTAVAVRQ